MAVATAIGAGAPSAGRRAAFVVPLAVVLAAATLVAGLRLTEDEAPAAARDHVLAYQAAVHPIAVEWGRLELQGMRPAVGDLRFGEGVPAETVAGEARHWQQTLRDLRARLAGVSTPPGLEQATSLFDRAFGEYLAAAVAFEEAAASEGEARHLGIDRGIERAKAGARLFNEASLVLQGARRDAGLPSTEDFPDHPAA